MNQDELLTQLLQRLDEPAARYAELDRYYQGKQPLAFLVPEAKVALGNRFGVMASNIPRLAVTALAERLRITGFSGDADLWADWIRNDLDQTSGVAHREALLLGDCFVIVWADQFGRPECHRRVCETGCGADRSGHAGRRTPAIKRWEDTSARPPRPCCTCRIGSCGCGPTSRVRSPTGSRVSTSSPTRWAWSRW